MPKELKGGEEGEDDDDEEGGEVHVASNILGFSFWQELTISLSFLLLLYFDSASTNIES